MLISYEKYFIPTRVANDFINITGEDITIPIIKRKLSAMIYATMNSRILISNNVYKHNYYNLEIIVEEEEKIVREVKYVSVEVVNKQSKKLYRKGCWHYGYNRDKNDFE